MKKLLLITLTTFLLYPDIGKATVICSDSYGSADLSCPSSYKCELWQHRFAAVEEGDTLFKAIENACTEAKRVCKTELQRSREEINQRMKEAAKQCNNSKPSSSVGSGQTASCKAGKTKAHFRQCYCNLSSCSQQHIKPQRNGPYTVQCEAFAEEARYLPCNLEIRQAIPWWDSAFDSPQGGDASSEAEPTGTL